MKLIQPVCRLHFQAKDQDFIAEALTRNPVEARALRHLLDDPEVRNEVLDDPALYRSLVDDPKPVKLSLHLYFYILTRKALRRHGIEDRDLADYIAEMMAECVESERAFTPGRPLEYLCDMMQEVANRNGTDQFLHLSYVANHCLFMTGLFADHIHERERRKGAPGLRYYEDTGRWSFSAAANHRLADRHALSDIYGRLSECFHEARVALNDMTTRLSFMGSAAPQL
jgi:hypothetical protein